MKKILTVISFIIAFIIIYLLQSNFFTWFNIAGVKPNLFVIFILFIGLFTGRIMGISMGISIGILIDLFISKKIGISGIMLGVIGFFGGYLDKNFSKESRITIMLMTASATLVFELGYYLSNLLVVPVQLELLAFVKIVIIEIIYNNIIIILLYPMLQKIGFFIEDIYRENKILTRYF